MLLAKIKKIHNIFFNRFNALDLENVDVFLQRLFKYSTTSKVLISSTDVLANLMIFMFHNLTRSHCLSPQPVCQSRDPNRASCVPRWGGRESLQPSPVLPHPSALISHASPELQQPPSLLQQPRLCPADPDHHAVHSAAEDRVRPPHSGLLHHRRAQIPDLCAAHQPSTDEGQPQQRLLQQQRRRQQKRQQQSRQSQQQQQREQR